MTSQRQDEDELIDDISLPRSTRPHPKALLNFSIARFFERLAFFAMCQWLILYLIAKSTGPDDTQLYFNAYQWVIMAVVFSQIPGGLFIDLFYKRRQAVVWGGAMLALGYFLLALNHNVATALALLFSFVGMGLYGVGSTGALGSYYRGRERYLTAGVYFYTAAINAAAFVASIALGLAAASLSWQQGAMLAAIMMMAGHVYLLAVAKTFQEPKLPVLQAHLKENSSHRSSRTREHSWVLLVVTLTSFLLASFAFNAGHKAVHSVEAWGAWSNHTRTLAYLLGAGAALIGSYLLTKNALSDKRLLGLGLLLTIVCGIIVPPLLSGSIRSATLPVIVASSSLLLMLIVAAEALVLAPAYAQVLSRGGKFTHTLLGLLSVFAHLPFMSVLYPEWFNIKSIEGTLLTVSSVAFMSLGAWWLIREGNKELP